jgi:hypothetical protein
MPELADVEGYRRYLARYATGKRIEGIEELLDSRGLREFVPHTDIKSRSAFGPPYLPTVLRAPPPHTIAGWTPSTSPTATDSARPS